MRSKWIEYKGKQIFYQDYSNLLFNADPFTQEISEVQAIMVQQPKHSVRVLANFTNTDVNSKLMAIINESSKTTKEYTYKAAILGVSGFKRTMADMVSRISGQAITYFDREEDALEWLVKDWNE